MQEWAAVMKQIRAKRSSGTSLLTGKSGHPGQEINRTLPGGDIVVSNGAGRSKSSTTQGRLHERTPAHLSTSKTQSERTRTTRSYGRSLRLIADEVETRKPWKCRTEESPENRTQVFRPSHRSWKSLCDSHIPTATVTTTYMFEAKTQAFIE